MKADTLRAPIARAEAPVLPDANGPWRWNRDQLFASGALTLGELLDRIPGAANFRPSWIHSPETVSMLGDPGSVRVFLDGVEIDELDPRNGRVLDLSEVHLWPLEEVVVERGARELRVHLRSWRYDRTIPNTRFDVSTGDQATNMYRGFLAKRYGHGEVFQAGVQQYSTSDPRTRIAGGQFAGGRSVAIILRTGWAARGWSVDAFLLRDGRTRNPEAPVTSAQATNAVALLGAPVSDSIPALRAVRSDAYVRAAYGDPEAGPWLQAMAVSSRFAEATGQTGSRLGPLRTHADTVRGVPLSDTTRSRAQYIVAGGLSRWGARLSATARARVFNGQTFLSPVGRASFDTRFGAVSARAERNGLNHATSLEAGISATPIPAVALSAVAERTQGANDGTPSGIAARGEAGLGFRGAWIAGGVMFRDSTLVSVPWVYYSNLRPDSAGHPPARLAVGQARGVYATVQGKVWRDVGIEATGTRWDSRDFFLPVLELRTDLFLRTRWLSRFPSGDFGVNANGIFEYRSSTEFPVGGPKPASVERITATGSRVLSTLLELRIKSAYITWQYRNIIGNGTPYALVPGYVMPRLTNLYGVRWEFFN